jgi:ATP-dependent Clp protease ATP-binding subunit ClpA
MIFVTYRKDAHQILEVARREARGLNHNYIGTEHLLLTLTVEDFGIATRALADCGVTEKALKKQVVQELASASDELTETDAAALASVGIDLSEVRRRVEEAFGPTALDAPACPTGTPFTDKALRAMKATPRYARRLRHRGIGPEHLLLALVDDESSLAVRLLVRLGTNRHVVRERMLAIIRSSAEDTAGGPTEVE